MRLDFVPQAKAAPIIVPAAIAALGTVAFAGVLFELFQQAMQNMDYGRVAQGALEQASYSTHTYEPIPEIEGPGAYATCLKECANLMGGKGSFLCFVLCAPALLAKGA